MQTGTQVRTPQPRYAYGNEAHPARAVLPRTRDLGPMENFGTTQLIRTGRGGHAGLGWEADLTACAPGHPPTGDGLRGSSSWPGWGGGGDVDDATVTSRGGQEHSPGTWELAGGHLGDRGTARHPGPRLRLSVAGRPRETPRGASASGWGCSASPQPPPDPTPCTGRTQAGQRAGGRRQPGHREAAGRPPWAWWAGRDPSYPCPRTRLRHGGRGLLGASSAILLVRARSLHSRSTRSSLGRTRAGERHSRGAG